MANIGEEAFKLEAIFFFFSIIILFTFSVMFVLVYFSYNWNVVDLVWINLIVGTSSDDYASRFVLIMDRLRIECSAKLDVV